jgi:hypothetical protein
MRNPLHNLAMAVRPRALPPGHNMILSCRADIFYPVFTRARMRAQCRDLVCAHVFERFEH